MHKRKVDRAGAEQPPPILRAVRVRQLGLRLSARCGPQRLRLAQIMVPVVGWWVHLRDHSFLSLDLVVVPPTQASAASAATVVPALAVAAAAPELLAAVVAVVARASL